MVFQCLDPSSDAVPGDKKEGVNWDDITIAVEFNIKARVELVSDENSLSLEKVRKTILWCVLEKCIKFSENIF